MRQLMYPDTHRQERLPRIKALISRYSELKSSLAPKADELYCYEEQARALILRLDAATMLLRSSNPHLVRNFEGLPSWDEPLDPVNANKAQRNLDILQARTLHLELLERELATCIIYSEGNVLSSLKELEHACIQGRVNGLDKRDWTGWPFRISAMILSGIGCGALSSHMASDLRKVLFGVLVGIGGAFSVSVWQASERRAARDEVDRLLSIDHDRIIKAVESVVSDLLRLSRESLGGCGQGVKKMIDALLPRASDMERGLAELSLRPAPPL